MTVCGAAASPSVRSTRGSLRPELTDNQTVAYVAELGDLLARGFFIFQKKETESNTDLMIL